jgi:anti-anti-sigma factor
MPTAGIPTVEELGVHDHACWVSAAGQSESSRLTRYLAAGLARDERVGFFAAPRDRVELIAANLAYAGVPVPSLIGKGQLLLGSAEEQYLPDGAFDPRRRLDGDTAAVRAAIRDGYQGLRVAADIAWLPAHEPAHRSWLGYEFGAEVLATRLPFTALCVYDPRHWQPQELALIASLHAVRVDYAQSELDTSFRVAAQRDGGIRLTGELDLTAASRYGEIVEVAAERGGVTVLDISELDFVDVAGLRMIARTGLAMIRHDGAARIRGASAGFRRLWELAGFAAVAPGIRVE